MLSGLHLVHLHPTSVVEPGGTSKVPTSVRDRPSPIREGKRQWEVCLHPQLEQGGIPPLEKKPRLWMTLFSLLQMGNSSSRTTLLKYIKKQTNKKPRQVWSPEFKRRHAWSSMILNGHSIFWKTGNAGQLKDLLTIILFYNYKTRKMGRSAICVAFYLSSRHATLVS